MKTRKYWGNLVLIIAVVCGIILLGSVPVTMAKGKKAPFKIASIKSKPYGKTYGEWAAEWQKWSLETPTSVSPVLDPDGSLSMVGQRGDVWLLAGHYWSGSVERTCKVPGGTALFFPLFNTAYCAFLNDPAEQRTKEYIRAQVVCTAPTTVVVKIDGVDVTKPLQYFEESPFFEAQLPEDNILNVTPAEATDLFMSPCADCGYYLFLEPLPEGAHTLYWNLVWPSYTSEATYHLTVRPTLK